MVKIREARIEDYDSLLPLFRQVHQLHVFERPDIYKENLNPVERSFYQNQINDSKQHTFVAHCGMDIYGFVAMIEVEITANSFLEARNILFVNSLCVAEKQRRNGIGKLIMEFVLDYGKKLNVNTVELGVSESNRSAIEFYESMGLNTKSRKMEFKLVENPTNIT